jgi:hypothetical protein
VVANPISSVIKKWKEEIDAYLKRKTAAKAGAQVTKWTESNESEGVTVEQAAN